MTTKQLFWILIASSAGLWAGVFASIFLWRTEPAMWSVMAACGVSLASVLAWAAKLEP